MGQDLVDPGGDEFPRLAQPAAVEKVTAFRRVEVHFQRLGAIVARTLDEAGRRIHRPGRADRYEQIALGQRQLDPFHLVGHFPEPDDIGPQESGLSAFRAWRMGCHVSGKRRPFAASHAPGAVQFAMHVQQAPRSGTVVQVIDILRHQQQVARPGRIEPRERHMRRIRHDGPQLRAPFVIEFLDHVRVAGKCLRRRDVLDPVPFPETVRAPECGDAALGADPGAGQDDDIVDFPVHAVPIHDAELVSICISPHRNSLNDKRALNQVQSDRDKMTAIGIIGCKGRMGLALTSAIMEAGEDHAGGVDQGDDLSALLAASEVLVDFSSPQALPATLDACVAAGKPLVIGTTGLEEVHHAAIDEAAANIAVLQTGNTSLGVNMLAALVDQAAGRLGEDWDVEIVEMHHRHKVDAPSGTAKLLGEAAAAGRGINLAANSESGRDGITGARKRGAIGFAALRGGSVAGDHSVIFATDEERIELTHRAENRMIFARGAVKAATWLAGQDPGRYRMQDVIGL